MDQLKTVVVLIIGMILVFPFLLKGQTTTQSTTATTPTTAAVVYTGCKNAEQNSPPSVRAGCVHICGDQILRHFNSVCGIQSGRKRSASGIPRPRKISLDKNEASNFLIKSRRSEFVRGLRSGNYNIVEECCYEKCIMEEIAEYC